MSEIIKKLVHALEDKATTDLIAGAQAFGQTNTLTNPGLKTSNMDIGSYSQRGEFSPAPRGLTERKKSF